MTATKAPPAPRPLHPDIPTDRAWQAGRRIYIRCGYHSQLNADLRALGAHWDREQRARWVGTAKRDQATALAIAGHARLQRLTDIRALGLWLAIPYEATHIREHAKELGALWMPDAKQWAMPTQDAYATVKEQRDAWVAVRARQAAAEQVVREAEMATRRAAWEAEDIERRIAAAGRREAERREAARREAERREEAIARAGRPLTGHVATRIEGSTRVMKKAEAHQHARRIGDIVHLPDGRTGLVTGRDIRFIPRDADGVCGHGGIHEGAHWCFIYRMEILAPTEEELDAAVQEATERADAAEIHDVMTQVPVQAMACAEDRWTEVPDEERVGTIVATTGVTGVLPAGHLIVTRDSRLIWQHPGHCDDYIRAEGITADPGLYAWARSLIDEGARERVIPGPVPVYYRVTVPHA